MTTYLPYRLDLRRPAVLSVPGGDPNSARTLTHIPGAALRGVVAAAVRHDTELLDRLVLNPAVRYLNAYLEIDGRRSVPVPHTWRRHTPTLALDTAADDPPPGTSTEPVAGYAVADNLTDHTAVMVGRPATVGRTHNRRGVAASAATGTAIEGTLYSYEAIAGAQHFRGLIAIDGDIAGRPANGPVGETASNIADELQALLLDEAGATDATNSADIAGEPAVLRIGRSKLAGYGGNATITWLPEADREIDPTWNRSGDLAASDRVAAVLLADCIARHPHTGHIDAAAVASAIEAAAPLRPVRRWLSHAATGGFNQRWGIPLPGWSGAAAGSVIVFEATAAVPSTALRAIEDRGIGLRRLDGFGRLVFVPVPATGSFNVDEPEVPRPARPDGPVPALVADLEQRRLQRMAEAEAARLARAAVDQPATARSLPSSSLIGRLRARLRQDGRSGLAALIGDDRLRAPARTQLTRCLVDLDGDRSSLLDALSTLANEPTGNIAARLDIDALAVDAAIAGVDPPELRPAELDGLAHDMIGELLDTLHLMTRTAARNAARTQTAEGATG